MRLFRKQGSCSTPRQGNCLAARPPAPQAGGFLIEDKVRMIARTPSGSVKTSARRAAQKKGHTMAGGSFPINDLGDLANAKHDVGRAKNPEAARRWINKRAKELGGKPLGAKRGGMIDGHGHKPHLGRSGRAHRAEGGKLPHDDTGVPEPRNSIERGVDYLMGSNRGNEPSTEFPPSEYHPPKEKRGGRT